MIQEQTIITTLIVTIALTVPTAITWIAAIFLMPNSRAGMFKRFMFVLLAGEIIMAIGLFLMGNLLHLFNMYTP